MSRSCQNNPRFGSDSATHSLHYCVLRVVQGKKTRIPTATIFRSNPGGIFKAADEDDFSERIEDEDSLTTYLGNPSDPSPPHIFDSEGNVISVFRFTPASSVGSALVDLSKTRKMFETRKSVQRDPRVVMRKTVDHYSLGFLDKAGSLQARQPFIPFRQAFKDVNKRIARRVSGEDDVTTEQEADPTFQPAYPIQTLSAVVPTSVQMYSLVSHLLSPIASENRSKHGEVTAVLAGAFATTQTEKDKAKAARDRLQTGLPAETFFRLIEDGPKSQALRIEQVFFYEMGHLKPEHRNGLCVYSYVALTLLTYSL